VPHVAPDGATTPVVYYVPAAGAAVAPDAVLRAVGFVLPGAAAVSCIPLPALPRLPGGKVNRHLLPHPDDPRSGRLDEPMVYRTPVEAGLARIWSEVLGVPVIPTAADFFALGGDSVSAFRVLTRIHAAFDVEVSVQDFFDHSTIAGLALIIIKTLAARSEALYLDARQKRQGSARQK
jgi:acyl carrier protein